MMKEKLYANVKRLAAIAVCAAMLTMTMGLSVFAATNGTISGSLNNSTAKVTLTNKSSNVRYCHVFILEATGVSASYTTVASNGGVVSSGNKISISGTISKAVVKGQGEIYRSSAPSSGVAASYYTRIK